MEIADFAEGRGSQREHEPAGQHLRAGAERFGVRERELACQHRGNRPADRGHDEREGAEGIHRSAPDVEGAAHQHRHSADPDQQRNPEANREYLRTQEENLGQRHKCGNGCEHNGRDSGRHSLFGPEQQAIVADENEESQDGRRQPLAPAGIALTGCKHPHEQDDPGGQKAHGGEEQRRDFVDANADRQKRRTPHEINDGEGQQRFPSGPMNLGVRGRAHKAL